MIPASTKARTFSVHIEEKSGLFFGTGPDIKGLFIAKHSAQEVDDAVPSAVQDLFAACNVHVVVSKLETATRHGLQFPQRLRERDLSAFLASYATL